MLGVMQARPPYVQFEQRAVEDRGQSIAEGRIVYRNLDFAMITPAGSKDTLEKIAPEWIDQIRRQSIQGTYDRQWADHFERLYGEWKKGNELPETGTPVREWPAISKAECAQLLQANVRTVEDLAALPESGLQAVGMGARELKRKAQAWMASAMDTGKVAEENAALKVQVETLQEQLKTVMDRLDAFGEDKPRRGRPPKEE